MVDDLIRRQDAIDDFNGVKVDEENCTEYDIGYNDGIDFAVSRLSVLLSAQPETSLITVKVTLEPEEIERVVSRIKDAPIMVLSSVQPEPQWIPCSEKMPRGQVEVIVSCHDDSGDTPFDYTSCGFTTTDGEYWIVDNEINNHVVAWCELPEPWEGGRT